MEGSGFQPPADPQVHQARLAALGLHPRAEGFGRMRVVGWYEVPLFPEVDVVECIVRAPWWMVRLEEWWPYEPRGWAPEGPGSGLADFYLNDDGTRLIGSYLAPPPIEPTTRFALVLYEGLPPGPLAAPDIEIPDSTPIPERLLRLIWLEM